MLVVAASAAFRATAGFSCSFTEAETGKSACNTSDQGGGEGGAFIYLFIYKRKQKKRRMGGRK